MKLRLLVVGSAIFWVAGALEARAMVWPDVAERLVIEMSAADPATRRAAARELASIGRARGGPLAIAALGDVDDDVRLEAADAAIRLHASGAADAVAGWLNAPNVRLRRKACEVARALPSSRLVAPLARTLGDADPEVRSAAADALGYQSPTDAVPPLLGRLDDPAPAVRIQLVDALARLDDPRATVPLVGKVQDSSQDVRQAVVRALGDLGDPLAAPALVLALRDPSEDVRRDALRGLGQMRAANGVDAIAPFVTDRSPALRTAAFSALGRIGSRDAVRVLVEALGTADDAADSLQRTAVRDALVTAGNAAVDPLRTLLSGSPTPGEATSAAWVLGELRAHEEAPIIVAALRRGTLPPAAALHVLALAGTAAEVPVVLEFLADPNSVVRDEALRAAAALLDPNQPDGRAVEPLAALMRDPRPSLAERVRIAALLGRTGAPRAAPLLADLARAADVNVRIAAIDALGVLGPAGADDALLVGLGSADPIVRVHSAMAVADAGGNRAREALLRSLDGGDEIDRAAVLTALGGVLARLPTDAAIRRLQQALELAAGPERDGIIEAIGRGPGAPSVRVLTGLVLAPEPADRAAAATLLAAHRADVAALSAVRSLLGDADPEVRANAAWSLGAIGDASDIVRLEAIVKASETDAAIDAAAAIGRIVARVQTPATSAPALCAALQDPRPYVRANAFAGLALGRLRCGDGSIERAAVSDDPNEDARAAAVRTLWRAPSSGDRRALDRCARTDSSGSVATRCRALPEVSVRTHPALVYVVADGMATPRPGSAYALLLADGMIRVGTTDRRGATFDPVAPEGPASLRPPYARPQ